MDALRPNLTHRLPVGVEAGKRTTQAVVRAVPRVVVEAVVEAAMIRTPAPTRASGRRGLTKAGNPPHVY